MHCNENNRKTMMEGQEIISDLRYEKNTLQSNFRMVKQYFSD
jgi:hypothetical protein